MLFRTLFDQLIPCHLLHHILSAIRLFWKPKSTLLSLVIEECDGIATSHLYNDVSEIYHCTNICPTVDRLKMTKALKDKNVSIEFAKSKTMRSYSPGASFARRPKNWSEEEPNRFSFETEK